MKNCWKAKGVTLVELLIGAGVFTVMMAIASTAGFQLYAGKQKIERTNELYTESRFVIDRIVQSVRVNTIDYYEYFNHNITSYDVDKRENLVESAPGVYGEHPGAYEMFFKYIPYYGDITGKHDISDEDFSWNDEDRADDINLAVFNTGADNYSSTEQENDSALGGVFKQKELYLLSNDGMVKTIFKREVSLDAEGRDIGKVRMLKLQLADSDSDGILDWSPLPSFLDGSSNPKFIDITPENINVLKLDFIVSPLDDPYKALRESVKSNGENPHIQPHVILIFSAQLSDKRFEGLQGENVPFQIQTSVASRVLYNVSFPRP